jgi:hypothetical protein
LLEQHYSGNCYSGRLHKHWVYVWEIKADQDSKRTLLAKVGVVPKKQGSPPPFKTDKEGGKRDRSDIDKMGDL